jgi:hypothetical protein
LHLVGLPETQIGEKIGASIGELEMRLVGRLSLVQWSLARILHRQRRGDDQHLAQACPTLSGYYDACQSWIDRQACKLAT